MGLAPVVARLKTRHTCYLPRGVREVRFALQVQVCPPPVSGQVILFGRNGLRAIERRNEIDQ